MSRIPNDFTPGDIVFVALSVGRPLAATVVRTNRKHIWVRPQRNHPGLEKVKRSSVRLWKAKNAHRRGNLDDAT